MKRRFQKQIYRNHLSDLIWDISLDPAWRKRLFSAPIRERIPVQADDLHLLSPELRRVIERHNSKFTVFNDGWTPEGFVVFGFSCVEFPYIDAYSTNNPDII